jgi:RNA polymerase sigma factor (sigma-70 family)
MEVSALKYSGGIGLHGRSSLLRLQSDDRLIAFVRRGNVAAFEALVGRYESRLLAFCRHLLGSREDAEDVLQDVFAAAFNALLADDRPINVKPWLYRIARNRSLNHLRKAQAVGVDSMDIHFSDNGESTADKVHSREEFRLLVGDIHELPESQKTALVLREMDALSYEHIAEAMETTVPSVKSLLVRARVSLAEAAEARLLSCDEVRIELGEIAEGLRRRPTPLVRRHLRACERCSQFKVQLRHTNRALAALLPLGPIALLRKLVAGHLPHSGSAAGSAAGSGVAGTGAAAGTAGAGAAAGVGVAAGAGAVGTGGLVSAGFGALATKAAVGLATAALVTAGAVEVDHSGSHGPAAAPTGAVAQVQQPAVPLAHTSGGVAATPSHRVGSGAAAKSHAHGAGGGKTHHSKAVVKKTSAPKDLIASATTTTPTTTPTTPTTATTTPSDTPTTPTTSTPAAQTPLPGRTQTQTDPTVLSGPTDTTASTTGAPVATTPTTTPTTTIAPVLPAPGGTTTTPPPPPVTTTPPTTTTPPPTTTTPPPTSTDPGAGSTPPVGP